MHHNTTAPVERQTVSVIEAATILGITELTVRRMIARGELHSIKVARRRLIPSSVIKVLLEGEQPGEASRDERG